MNNSQRDCSSGRRIHCRSIHGRNIVPRTTFHRTICRHLATRFWWRHSAAAMPCMLHARMWRTVMPRGSYSDSNQERLTKGVKCCYTTRCRFSFVGLFVSACMNWRWSGCVLVKMVIWNKSVAVWLNCSANEMQHVCVVAVVPHFINKPSPS